MVFCFSGLLLSLLPPVTAQMMTQTLGDRRQGRAASFTPQMTYLPTLCSQDILGSFLVEEIDVLYPSTHDYMIHYMCGRAKRSIGQTRAVVNTIVIIQISLFFWFFLLKNSTKSKRAAAFASRAYSYM